MALTDLHVTRLITLAFVKDFILGGILGFKFSFFEH